MTPLDFLMQLYEHCEPAWLSLFTIDRAEGRNRVHWYRTDWLGLTALVDDADAEMRNRCVWYGVATRRQPLEDGARGGATDCLQVPALWVDIDVRDPIRHKTQKPLPPDLDAGRELIADHPLAPTFIVETGGGLHGYWLLDEPLDATEAQPVLDPWRDTWVELARRRGWHIDSGVYDVPRILRLPGSRNTKGVNRG